MIDFYKTGLDAKAVRARLKDNPDFLRYAVLQVHSCFDKAKLNPIISIYK